MSDPPRDRTLRRDRRGGKAPSEGSHGARGRAKDSISTVSCLDELGQHDDNTRMPVTMENTYQLEILKDVLSSYLQEEKYEVEWSQKMSKTICEVIRARVKDLLIPRYKTVVLVHIGQLVGQSIQISSRCLWDASSDTFASFSFKNRSLFGVANVYAVYFE